MFRKHNNSVQFRSMAPMYYVVHIEDIVSRYSTIVVHDFGKVEMTGQNRLVAP